MVEVRELLLPEAGVLGTDWATTGIYSLKGAHLLVHRSPRPAHRRRHMADTEIAATKGTGTGEMLSPPALDLVSCGLESKCLTFLHAAILARSQTAAFPATCSLSCPGEARKEDVVEEMIGTEPAEEEREDEVEEAKPTEEEGKL